MRLLKTEVLLTTVRFSVGKKLMAKSPATTGRLALPPTTMTRLAAPPNWPMPDANSSWMKFRLPLT